MVEPTVEEVKAHLAAKLKKVKEKDANKGVIGYLEAYDSTGVKTRLGVVYPGHGRTGAFFKLKFKVNVNFPVDSWICLYPRNGDMQFIVMKKGTLVGL